MAFGLIMRLQLENLTVELAPFNREEVATFVEGMSRHSVTRYLATRTAQTKELEEEWYDKMIHDKYSVVWGIWITEAGERKLIGGSSLDSLELNSHIRQATSGSMIFDQAYWGRGIASACHKARTLYAFEQLGLHRIKSAVDHPNAGSRKALERSGYTLVYTERNKAFVDGKLVHQDCLECLNPADWAWHLWWGNDRPPRKNFEARKRTEEALAWARANVTLL